MNSSATRRVLALVIGATAMAGCTTYVGHKLPPDGALPTGKTSGIPFVMTRPEYSVDIAPDANDPTKAVYTLKSKDVPDPTQRYTIALDPALFVDGTLDLAFGELGNITSATATTTSRVVATIESVVSFAINKAASAVAKDMGTSLGAYRKVLRGAKASECTKTVNGTALNLVLDSQLQKLLDEANLEQTETDETKRTAKASSLVAARFHYLNQEQKACLAAVVPDAKTSLNEGLGEVEKNYLTALAAAKDAGKDSKLAQEWIANLEAAVKSQDVAAVEVLAKSATVPDSVTKVSAAAKTFINTALDAKRLSLMSEQFAFMPPEVWRARHLQQIERQLKQRRLERLLGDNSKPRPVDSEIARLEGEWAETLGEPKLVQRIAELDTFLAQVRVVPANQGSGPRYAASEHVQLREERDKLQERVDRLRNELVAKNKVIDAEPEKKKVEPRTDVRVKLVKPSFIEKVAANPGTVPDLPEYVLVVSPIAEPTVFSYPESPVKAEVKK